VARLIFSAIASLDGYTADEAGNFDWAAPDAELHAFVNDLERGVGTHLYGRRMYETMAVWETRDISVGGPGLAAHALRAGVVDEIQLMLVPVVVGGGTRALPAGLRADLDLLDERRFASGAVYLRYQSR
jgi:dihydrofolate reductase